jgi:hypothetical protein
LHQPRYREPKAWKIQEIPLRVFPQVDPARNFVMSVVLLVTSGPFGIDEHANVRGSRQQLT